MRQHSNRSDFSFFFFFSFVHMCQYTFFGRIRCAACSYAIVLERSQRHEAAKLQPIFRDQEPHTATNTTATFSCKFARTSSVPDKRVLGGSLRTADGGRCTQQQQQQRRRRQRRASSSYLRSRARLNYWWPLCSWTAIRIFSGVQLRAKH